MILGGVLLILAGLLIAWLAAGRPSRPRERQSGPGPEAPATGGGRAVPSATMTGALRAIDMPQVEEDAAAADFTDLDEKERDALRSLLKRIDDGLGRDDPNIWPDASRARALLDAAEQELDAAELEAEWGAGRSGGGIAAGARIEQVVRSVLTAHHHKASREEVLCALGRAVLCRARAKKDRHFREGAVAVVRFANEAITRKPGFGGARVLHVRSLVALGRLDTARHALVELMRERPDDVELLRVRSRWLRAHGDRIGAQDAVERYLDRLTGAVADLESLRLARWLTDARRYAEAAPMWERLVERHPDSAEAWLGRARALGTARQWESAEEAARKAVEILPDRDARELLGQIIGRSMREPP